jgi:hypothetical protein
MWYADNHMRVAGLCDYCLDDFEDLPPVFIRGYAFLAAHRPGDKYGGDCAYWLDWQEYGRWETNRGSQGERKWPDGREWNPEPWTDEPKEAYCKDCNQMVELIPKLSCFLCARCRVVVINR